MLTSTEKLAKILGEDLSKTATPRVDRRALAADCDGISQQAISNWIKTGRVSKQYLKVIARHTGRPLERYLPESDNEQPPAPADVVPLHGQGAAANQNSLDISAAKQRILAALDDLDKDHLELLAEDIERDAAINRRKRQRRG